MRQSLHSCAATLIACTLVIAQSPAPAFEVASVKLNNSGSQISRSSSQNNDYTATNVTVRFLIQSAYRLRTFQLAGGPDWIDSERFDIQARAPENAPPDAVFLMLRALLSQRFGLVVHTETKEQPVYALVPARSDGRLGPQIKRSTLECSAGPQNPCGMNANTNNTMGTLKGGSRSMTELAETLGNFVVDRMVVDRTGLTDKYDLELKWTVTPNEASSIFTALQEQLGLKLDSQRGPVEFLVIDKVDHPIPN